MAIAISSDSNILLRTLDNGLTVALERLPFLRSATAGIWVKTGSVNEQPHESGLAHFLEHLFFKGTTTRSTHEIMKAIEGRGGHLNAFTSREHTCLYVKMLDDDIAVGIEILADLMKNSLFLDLEKEKNVILEEIASIEDTPDDYVHDLLAEHHWPDHPLGRPIGGTVESVSALSLDHVTSFFKNWYTPDQMVFSVAGNIVPEVVLRQVEAEFGSVAPGPHPAIFGPPTFQGGVNVIERDIAQDHVCLAFPACPVGTPERHACDLASSILGGGSTSWLFEKIREEEGLAYSIYTFTSFHQTAGMLGVYAAVAPESTRQALDLTFEAFRKLRDEGVSPEELEMNRQQIKGNMLMALESTSTRMSRMAKSLLYYGRIISVDEMMANLDAVTPEQIQRFAQQSFGAQTCALTILGPETKGRDGSINL